jgi:hypothetical protein
MADSVGDGDGAALRMAEESEFIEASRVHNNFQIADPGFEGNFRDVPGGKAVAAAVIAKNARAVCEIAHPMPPDGAFPFEVEMVETVCNSDEGMAGANGGVGEADVVRSDAEANFLARRGSDHSRRREGGRGGVAVRNGSKEAVADAGDGFDKGAAAGLFAESFAESGDVAVEIVFFDDGFGPDGGHEVLLGHEVAASFDKNPQSLEGLAGDRNTGALAEQAVLAELQAKGAELVDNVGGFLAHSFRKIAEKIQSRQRTQAPVRRVNGQRREPAWIARNCSVPGAPEEKRRWGESRHLFMGFSAT